MFQTKLTLGATMTVTNTPEEAEGTKEALAVKVAAVAMITEITQLLNCCLMGK